MLHFLSQIVFASPFLFYAISLHIARMSHNNTKYGYVWDGDATGVTKSFYHNHVVCRVQTCDRSDQRQCLYRHSWWNFHVNFVLYASITPRITSRITHFIIGLELLQRQNATYLITVEANANVLRQEGERIIRLVAPTIWRQPPPE